MKFCTALFFGFFIFNHGSFAFKCEPTVRVNVTLIANNYGAYVDSLPQPILEYGDKAAGGFKNTYTKAVQFYSWQLMNNLYDEAKYRGDELVKDIIGAINRLKKEIESLSPHNRKPNCLEEALGRVVGQMNIFLNLKPEKTSFQMPQLPQLPVQLARTESRSAIRSREEIFFTFTEVTDSLANQIFTYLTDIYLKGWKVVRRDFEVVRTQVYGEILNGPAINAYGEAVLEVKRYREVICRNVSQKTWHSFEVAAEQIIKIWKNCDRHGRENPHNSREY